MVKITQGAFSFLPPLDDLQIDNLIWYGLEHDWSISIEHTASAHPRNCYWEMWGGSPIFDAVTPYDVTYHMDEAISFHDDSYVKLCFFDSSEGNESCALSFIVNRPWSEFPFEFIRHDKTTTTQG